MPRQKPYLTSFVMIFFTFACDSTEIQEESQQEKSENVAVSQQETHASHASQGEENHAENPFSVHRDQAMQSNLLALANLQAKQDAVSEDLGLSASLKADISDALAEAKIALEEAQDLIADAKDLADLEEIKGVEDVSIEELSNKLNEIKNSQSKTLEELGGQLETLQGPLGNEILGAPSFDIADFDQNALAEVLPSEIADIIADLDIDDLKAKIADLIDDIKDLLDDLIADLP